MIIGFLFDVCCNSVEICCLLCAITTIIGKGHRVGRGQGGDVKAPI